MGLDVELFQVGVPEVAVAVFHFISLVEVLQSGLSDVDTSDRGSRRRKVLTL